jgi:hypothetical protein
VFASSKLVIIYIRIIKCYNFPDNCLICISPSAILKLQHNCFFVLHGIIASHLLVWVLCVMLNYFNKNKLKIVNLTHTSEIRKLYKTYFNKRVISYKEKCHHSNKLTLCLPLLLEVMNLKYRKYR